ncbi:hypothetical protein M426DRAFT_7287 [Hypoxylon sp. CI-4A]|nr:hypothetical protein M426DRAFT_7287 [Hypoxylon sp. CI-4A]
MAPFAGAAVWTYKLITFSCFSLMVAISAELPEVQVVTTWNLELDNLADNLSIPLTILMCFIMITYWLDTKERQYASKIAYWSRQLLRLLYAGLCTVFLVVYFTRWLPESMSSPMERTAKSAVLFPILIVIFKVGEAHRHGLERPLSFSTINSTTRPSVAPQQATPVLPTTPTGPFSSPAALAIPEGGY